MPILTKKTLSLFLAFLLAFAHVPALSEGAAQDMPASHDEHGTAYLDEPEPERLLHQGTVIDTDPEGGYTGDYVIIYNPENSQNAGYYTGTLEGKIITEVEPHPESSSKGGEAKASFVCDTEFLSPDRQTKSPEEDGGKAGHEPTRAEYPVGATRSFKIYYMRNPNPDGGPIEFKVLTVGEHCRVWTPVEAQYGPLDLMNPTYADKVTAMFDSKYPLMERYYGSFKDTNGDGKVNLLFYNYPSGSMGYFYPNDLQTDWNYLPILHLNTGAIGSGIEDFYYVIVHEFEHLINQSELGYTSLWFNEGFACSAMELCFPGSQLVDSVTGWTGETDYENPAHEHAYYSYNDAQNGGSILNFENNYIIVTFFSQYLLSKFGTPEVYRRVIDDFDNSNMDALGSVARSCGVSIDELIRDFFISLVANDNDAGYGFILNEGYDPGENRGIVDPYALLAPMVCTSTEPRNIYGFGFITVKPVGGVFVPPEDADSRLHYVGITVDNTIPTPTLAPTNVPTDTPPYVPPVMPVPTPDPEPTPTPEPDPVYNEYEYQKILAFLEQTDENGTKYGKLMLPGYDPDDPSTWSELSGPDGYKYYYGVKWTDRNERRIESIIIGARSFNGMLDVSGFDSLKTLNLASTDLDEIDITGCTSLETLSVFNSGIREVDVSNSTSLRELYCGFNSGISVNVTGCSALELIDGEHSDMTALDLSGCSSLRELYLFVNGLTELDLSDCASIEYIDCRHNALTSLDVSECHELRELQCEGNTIREIDVSGLSSLMYLICTGCQTERVDASGCASLIELECSSNNITELDVSGCTSLLSLGCAANQLTELDVSDCGHLTKLGCLQNSITELDLRNCPMLAELLCQKNDLSNLFVSGCGNLKKLDCSKNSLTSLDLSGCFGLRNLNCSINSISELGISDCVKLNVLNCSGNSIGDIDCSGLISLHSLNCSGCVLTSLDISDCNSLFDLNCRGNEIVSLQASDIRTLVKIDCDLNQLADLTIIGCANLMSISAWQNELTELDLTGCRNLRSLTISNNPITDIDLTQCKGLKSLGCSGMNLSELDVSFLAELEGLSCDGNALTSLDFSQNHRLTSLNCRYNSIQSIDLSGNPQLADLNCAYNCLTELDVSVCPHIVNLRCEYNSLSELDLSGCSKLYSLSCYDNALTELDVSDCPNLDDLDCRHNNLKYMDFTHNPHIPFDRVWADGSGTLDIFCPYYQKTISAAPDPGSEFLGWYSDEGDFINSNTTLYGTDTAFTRIVARFTGWGEAPLQTPAPTPEPTPVPTSAPIIIPPTPEGYNEHDYIKAVSFLEQTDFNGVKNGKKINPSYNPEDPETWKNSRLGLSITWTEVSAEKRLYTFGLSYTAVGLTGSLDVSGCTNIRQIDIDRNPISSVDVSGCMSLNALNCSSCNISEIILSGCSALTVLRCGDNQLNELSLSDCPDLWQLFVGGNNLTELDVSGKEELFELGCGDNQYTELRLYDLPQLERLYCSDGDLTLLDTSGCPKLRDLNCYNNSLTELDLSNNPKLVTLRCENNQLTELNITACESLTELRCNNNRLSALDISGCPRLNLVFICTDNLLTEIDLTNNPAVGFEKILSSGNGTIGYYRAYEYNFVTAKPAAGEEFLGWYSEDGQFITDNTRLNKADTDFMRVAARFSGTAPEPTPVPVMGDVDGSGVMNSFDALLILRYALGMVWFSDEQTYLADVNADGKVDTFDALLVMRYSLGLIASF